MSAKIKIIPRDQRLRVTARFDHQTVQYGGDIFKFIEQLMADKRTGLGTFRLNSGDAYGLEFDFRSKRAENVVDITDT